MIFHTYFRCDIIPSMLLVGHHFYFNLWDCLIPWKSVETRPVERSDHFFSGTVGLDLTLWTDLFADLDFQIKTRFLEGRHTEHRCLTKLETPPLRKNTAQHLDLLLGWPHPLANPSLLQSVFMEWIVTQSRLLATYLKTPRCPKDLLIFVNPRHSHVYIFKFWPSSEHIEKQTQTPQKQHWQATELSSQAPFQLPCMMFVIRKWWVDARLGVAWESRLDR